MIPNPMMQADSRRPNGPVYRPQGQSTTAPHWGFHNPFAGVNGGWQEHPIESGVVVGSNAIPVVGPLASRLLRWAFDRHNRNQQNNNPGWNQGSPGAGYNNGQLGNPYGGFGNG